MQYEACSVWCQLELSNNLDNKIIEMINFIIIVFYYRDNGIYITPKTNT